MNEHDGMIRLMTERMKRIFGRLLSVAALGIIALPLPAATLDIYYLDTEGGQSTLFVAPSGQTVLVDTGFPGGRDAARIMQAVTAAGASQIDYLVITHYHGDHVGGFPELAKLIPIRHLVDHGPTVETQQVSASRDAYEAATRRDGHLIAAVGQSLPLADVKWTFVSAAGKTLTKTLTGAPGAGRANPDCGSFAPKDIQVGLENAQSVGSVIEYGKFRTADLGDLLWNLEFDLMCPVNRIGTLDVLLTSHHGMSWSGSPVLVHALHPRVAVMNNGLTKGGEIEAFETLESSPGLENLWQLHWSANGLLEHNVAGRFIANLEDVRTTGDIIANPPPAVVSATGPAPANAAPVAKPKVLGDPQHSPAYWIKVSAEKDGTFSVTNSRNGFSKTYRRHD